MLNSIYIVKGESMRRKTILASCFVSLLLAGCTSKEETALLQSYNQKKRYHKKLMHTEKAQLYDGNETKVLLTVTYLYDRSEVKQEEDTRDEVFIVGLYMEDETVKDQLSRDFSLTLNGTLPKSVTVLKHSDKRLKDIPFVTVWGNYFEVIFPHTNSSRFDLLFNSTAYGKKVLHFAKKAKYVFTKEAF